MFEVRPSDQDLLTIDRQEQDGTVTLSLYGEVDLLSAPLLQQELEDVAQISPRRIVLDLSALAFIDSTGLHTLLQAQDHADSNGGVLVLTNVPQQARELLRVTGLDAHIPTE